jgi:cytochrome c-type biogenesis protein CcsB
MYQFEIIAFVASLVALQLALVLYIWGFISTSLSKLPLDKTPARFALPALMLAWLSLTASLIARAISTGHVPFTDMYEFTASFSWGILLAVLLCWWRFKSDIISAAGALVALALLAFAFSQPSQHTPLAPILNQSWLLPAHVSCAIIAYGLFALGFASAVLFLVRQRYTAAFLPRLELLDRIGYESSLTGFLFLTAVLILGSIWANIAWGSYWSWDPKETAALVTWLIYAGYLFTRFVLKWRDSRSAWFLVIGFLSVLVTFFGNFFFGGLHSYAS